MSHLIIRIIFRGLKSAGPTRSRMYVDHAYDALVLGHALMRRVTSFANDIRYQSTRRSNRLCASIHIEAHCTWTNNFSFYRAADGRQTVASHHSVVSSIEGGKRERGGGGGSSGCAAISPPHPYPLTLPLVPSFPVKWFPHCAGCKDGQTGGILTSFVQLDITGLEEGGERADGGGRRAVAPVLSVKCFLYVSCTKEAYESVRS